MKRTCSLLVLVCALSGPGTAQASDDMFGMMFRMMLTMMNVMSDTMLGNSDTGWGNNWTGNLGFGSFNPASAGMGSWPMMSGLGSPFTAFGYSPFNTFGMSPWSGMSPWTGFSPWSLGSNPWSSVGGGPSAWQGMTPFGGSGSPNYPMNFGNTVPGDWYGSGYPAAVSLLDGRWYGTSGEILEIRGNQFRLRQGRVSVSGAITVYNDIVTLYSTQTNTATRYTFLRNQSGLILQDAYGKLLRYTNRPYNPYRVF